MAEMRRPARWLALLLGVTLVACGGSDSSSASASAEDGEPIIACDLVTRAEIEEVLGGTVNEPDSNVSDQGGSTASACIFSGEAGGVLVHAWHPYHSGEPTSAAWAAKLQADRDRDIAEETDPEMKEFNEAMAGVQFQPLDDLGVPAAWEDLGAEADQAVVHAVKGGKGGVYVAVRAANLDIARAVTLKALARIR